MSEPDRERSPADRTIVIEGPFQTGHGRDGHWAKATIKAQGRQYRVAVVIPGQSDFHHFFGMTDEEREEARGWFALVELAQCPTTAFASAPSESLVDVTVRIAQAPPLQRWVIEDVLHYVHEELREYVLERKGSTWQAQPGVYPQARPAASPQTRPPAHPQVQPPRLQPRPAKTGPKSNADRGWKIARPIKIIFDHEHDRRPPATPGSKKRGGQTFWDSFAGIIKTLGRT